MAIKKKAVFIYSLLILLVACAAFFWFKKPKPTIQYKEVKIEKGDLSLSILATGTVQPENRLSIKPTITGRVEEVKVKEGEKVRKGQILIWMSSSERAALLDAARAQGEAEIKKWEDLYKATPIFAPINGTIISRNVEPGQSFTNADALLVMSDRLTVKAQVDETDIAKIKVGQKAVITLDAYQAKPIESHVDQIAFDATTVNNVTTYIVNVLPESTPPEMRSGMTANVSFKADTKENILLVPNEALIYEGDRAQVLIPSEKGKALKVPIELGLSDGHKSEVVGGVGEGQTLLIEQIDFSASQGGSSSPFSPMRRSSGGSGKRSPSPRH